VIQKKEWNLVLSTWFGCDCNMEHWIENSFLSLWIVLILMCCGRLKEFLFFSHRIFYSKQA